jgi:hypothetical protein
MPTRVGPVAGLSAPGPPREPPHLAHCDEGIPDCTIQQPLGSVRSGVRSPACKAIVQRFSVSRPLATAPAPFLACCNCPTVSI